MTRILFLVGWILITLTLLGIAGYGFILGKEGWGWWLIGAILIGGGISMTTKSEK